MLHVDNFSSFFLYLFTKAAIKLLSSPPESKQATSLCVLSILLITALVNDFLISLQALLISFSLKSFEKLFGKLKHLENTFSLIQHVVNK